jgi:hypothetical protein
MISAASMADVGSALKEFMRNGLTSTQRRELLPCGICRSREKAAARGQQEIEKMEKNEEIRRKRKLKLKQKKLEQKKVKRKEVAKVNLKRKREADSEVTESVDTATFAKRRDRDRDMGTSPATTAITALHRQQQEEEEKEEEEEEGAGPPHAVPDPTRSASSKSISEINQAAKRAREGQHIEDVQANIARHANMRLGPSVSSRSGEAWALRRPPYSAAECKEINQAHKRARESQHFVDVQGNTVPPFEPGWRLSHTYQHPDPRKVWYLNRTGRRGGDERVYVPDKPLGSPVALCGHPAALCGHCATTGASASANASTSLVM